jgi:hypothetical protein
MIMALAWRPVMLQDINILTVPGERTRAKVQDKHCNCSHVHVAGDQMMECGIAPVWFCV